MKKKTIIILLIIIILILLILAIFYFRQRNIEINANYTRTINNENLDNTLTNAVNTTQSNNNIEVDGSIEIGRTEERGFIIDNVLHSESQGDIHQEYILGRHQAEEKHYQ